MRILLQRVSQASVTISDGPCRKIGDGLLAFVGVTHSDCLEDAERLARQTLTLRIFPDIQQRMNRSICDIGGDILVISQFTLYADTRKGNRPSFIQAAAPEHANVLYQNYISTLQAGLGSSRIQTGEFGAHMEIALVNDGPVTIWLEHPVPRYVERSSDVLDDH